MNNENYLLKTGGRTASHLIVSHFVKHGYKHYSIFKNNPTEVFNSIENNTSAIVHDHSLDHPVNTNDWNLIINKRKDLFSLALSAALAWKNGNYGGKPRDETYNIRIEKNEFEIDLFKKCRYQNYYDLLVTHYSHLWKSVNVIYYEDFINNPTKLSNVFGGNTLHEWNDTITYPSLDHKKSVSNYDELKYYYNDERVANINNESKISALADFKKTIKGYNL